MAKLERKKFEARKKDGKLRTRKTGFSKFSYQANNRVECVFYNSYNLFKAHTRNKKKECKRN
ncbi:hypothetical protein PFFVO_06167 [Plasmodium falciparum Vietnam Oak-Knoll (FVO)]|uniref:Uncharacterized protein n=1 Tax=Plasmodium falciparum Vietnam Oak-Knoll (FVO) TaxID=1036723 RepID=A0A024UY23_PLAFA|nr:hypothetical protein PFFVO_06167 [Plasmodium falciparum Vietnam Oak-Knoll (FVO)]